MREEGKEEEEEKKKKQVSKHELSHNIWLPHPSVNTPEAQQQNFCSFSAVICL